MSTLEAKDKFTNIFHKKQLKLKVEVTDFCT